jgi:hypothetical protein
MYITRRRSPRPGSRGLRTLVVGAPTRLAATRPSMAKLPPPRLTIALNVAALAVPVGVVMASQVIAPTALALLPPSTFATKVWPLSKYCVTARGVRVGRDVLVDRAAVQLVDEVHRLLAVEGETFVRHARHHVAQDEVAAVGGGRRRIGHLEQAALLAARAPRFFGRQVRTPRRPAGRVTGDEALRARRDDRHGAGGVVRVPEVDALHAARARLEGHEQVAAGVRARFVGGDHVPVARVGAGDERVLRGAVGEAWAWPATIMATATESFLSVMGVVLDGYGSRQRAGPWLENRRRRRLPELSRMEMTGVLRTAAPELRRSAHFGPRVTPRSCLW